MCCSWCIIHRNKNQALSHLMARVLSPPVPDQRRESRDGHGEAEAHDCPMEPRRAASSAGLGGARARGGHGARRPFLFPLPSLSLSPSSRRHAMACGGAEVPLLRPEEPGPQGQQGGAEPSFFPAGPVVLTAPSRAPATRAPATGGRASSAAAALLPPPSLVLPWPWRRQRVGRWLRWRLVARARACSVPRYLVATCSGFGERRHDLKNRVGDREPRCSTFSR